MDRLWEHGDGQRSNVFGLGATGEGAEESDRWQPDRLNLEVGYGVLQGGVATTWYGGLSKGAEVTWRLGNRVKVGASGHLDLEFQIQEQEGGPSLHGFGVRTGLKW